MENIYKPLVRRGRGLEKEDCGRLFVGLFSNTKYFVVWADKKTLSMCLLPISPYKIFISLLLLSFLSLPFSPTSILLYAMEADEDVPEPRFRKICVFCGSRAGNKSSFGDATLQLGKQLVEKKIDLIYGGGSVGLMGLISQTVYNGGCHVLGIIPKALLPHEISGKTIGETKIVADMHERKSEMSSRADAFIALPGGYGTMEELLEMITWAQLGIHDKPVGLLNVDGYYNSLLALFDKGVEEGFIEEKERHIIVSADNPAELIKKMEEYAPVHDKVAPRQCWEVDQLLESCTTGNPF